MAQILRLSSPPHLRTHLGLRQSPHSPFRELPSLHELQQIHPLPCLRPHTCERKKETLRTEYGWHYYTAKKEKESEGRRE